MGKKNLEKENRKGTITKGTKKRGTPWIKKKKKRNRKIGHKKKKKDLWEKK